MMVEVVLQVSVPYNRSVMKSVLKNLTLMLTDSCFEFHMCFNCSNATLTLSILAFISASDHDCLSMILSGYIKLSISSRALRLSVIGLVFSVSYLRILFYPLCMLRPTDAQTATILVFFICICSCICDIMVRSSVKSKSSGCTRTVHCILCFP